MQDIEPYLITKKRTVRKIYWGRIIVVAVLAAALAAGGIVWFSRRPGKLHVRERTYWFVAMGEYGDLPEAAARADAVATGGGAGYLYGSSPYVVMAACYADRQDAETVRARLVGSGETATLFSLSCPAFAVEKPKKEADLLGKLLTYPQEIFDELYDISLKTDKKELSEGAAMYAVGRMSGACVSYAQDCLGVGTEAGERLAKLYTELSVSLDVSGRQSGGVPQALKYTLCETAAKICAEAENFAK